MKILIIILMLFPILLFAQNKDKSSKEVTKEQLKEAMVQISSNSVAREMMLKMILNKTNDSKEEMTKLGKIILDDPAMKSIIKRMTFENARTFDSILEPRKMMKDSTRQMKMSSYKQDPGK